MSFIGALIIQSFDQTGHPDNVTKVTKVKTDMFKESVDSTAPLCSSIANIN